MNLLHSARQPSDIRRLYYADFNQDYGCFAVGLRSGFRIFNCDPLEETKRHGMGGKGIGTVSMLYRTNYVALTGGGPNPKFPLNTVIIWDDSKEKEVIRLEFRSEVKNVKLLRERMIIVLQDRVYVYTFSAQPKKLYMFETPDNDKGLVAVASSRSMSVLAFPGQQPGHIQVVDLGQFIASSANATSTSSGSTTSTSPHTPSSGITSNDTASSLKRSNSSASSSSHSHLQHRPRSTSMSSMMTNKLTIMAHTASLGYIAMSQSGHLLASASEKGTLIRVFDTQTGRILHEFRRGADRADIYSIAFNADATRLCVASDKGTIHIFNLDVTTATTPLNANSRLSTDETTRDRRLAVPSSPSGTWSGNRHSRLAFMKDLLPKYFSSEWSFAHCQLPTHSRFICGFGPSAGSIIVICSDGGFYKFTFDQVKGGACVRESYHRFLKLGDDDEDDDDDNHGNITR
ncbi:WD40-repeat-containing domain protein [Syncephalis plumigaleata]|nr:WD40-repeat-containing domain protein [Syncephalis plumigaleata]